MRKHSGLLLGGAFLILCVCFLLAMSCSWDIVTKGEVLKTEAAIEQESIQALEPILEILEILPGREDNPDSIRFRVHSLIYWETEELYFVEMEVGELREAQGTDPDTIITNHRP